MSATRVRRILLADDDAAVREYVAEVLGRIPGVDITVVSSGEAALEALRERTFDLIVTDQRMGRVSGVDVLADAQVRSPGTVRVMITAYADLDLLESVVNGAHVTRFIAKPFSPEELLSRIEPLLASA